VLAMSESAYIHCWAAGGVPGGRPEAASPVTLASSQLGKFCHVGCIVIHQKRSNLRRVSGSYWEVYHQVVSCNLHLHSSYLQVHRHNTRLLVSGKALHLPCTLFAVGVCCVWAFHDMATICGACCEGVDPPGRHGALYGSGCCTEVHRSISGVLLMTCIGTASGSVALTGTCSALGPPPGAQPLGVLNLRVH
jgi:hypothetical protein